ncbi:hypothetical protein Aoki45_34440 [Algoriphagus sp. oki45]|uniref:energy transducer TonB n=1 Tax=Algoriphagus sp. oki45 TaxID=3067294 RepID=UPI0027F64965|nr:hypothetical protein Aoki45_34440 [Algoriphagus sp. oki45]
MRILYTFILCICVCSMTWSQKKDGKQNEPYLNRHFFEIGNKDLERRAYRKVTNELENGDQVFWIFDMENQMVVQGKVEINQEGLFKQETREYLNEEGSIKRQTIKNLDNGKYVTSFFENGEKKGQVLRLEDQSYSLWRISPEREQIRDRDDFKPGLDMDRLQELFVQNLQYPIAARRLGQSGTVQIALLISETGELKELEVANGYGLNKELVKEALRVIRLYEGPFYPALDLQGNPVEAWMYLPVRFSLG